MPFAWTTQGKSACLQGSPPSTDQENSRRGDNGCGRFSGRMLTSYKIRRKAQKESLVGSRLGDVVKLQRVGMDSLGTLILLRSFPSAVRIQGSQGASRLGSYQCAGQAKRASRWGRSGRALKVGRHHISNPRNGGGRPGGRIMRSKLELRLSDTTTPLPEVS